MFNCCMPNYNMFMGGCCGNSIMDTMFKMQMFKAIMNNIFHPYEQQQSVCYQPMQMPMMTQMPVMPMMPQPMMSMAPAYPSIFSMAQNPSVNFNNNYYNDNSSQGPSLIDIFKDAYNSVFKKKAKKDEEAEETEKSEKKAKKNKKIVISRSEITDIVHKKAEKYGVDEKLILAIINQESGFKNGQTSKKGAKGLMQLMPATAKELGVTDPNDPEQNIDAGVRCMKKLLNRYNGDIKKALAAYNWGMGNLDKYGMQKAPKETRNYVSTIYDNYKNYDVA